MSTSYPDDLKSKFKDDFEDRVIGAEDIRLMVFTCDRYGRSGHKNQQKFEHGEQYIYPMLASFWMSHPLSHKVAGVDLMVDGEDVDYLYKFFRHTEKVKLHPSLPGALDNIPNKGQEMGCMGTPHARLTRNYINTLKFALSTDQKGFIICEDDVVFLDGFMDYALDAINEMRCTKLPKDDNTLVLYHRKKYVGASTFYRGRYFCSAGGGFEGLCGVYYDRDCLGSLIAHLEANEPRLPADLLYAEWGDKEWTRYASIAGLVQHVGGISAGTSPGSYWTAPHFQDPIHCWDPVWDQAPYERFFLRRD
jgi:hypothetical protein